MNFNYLKLLAWVTQSLAPVELIGKDLTSADLVNWKTLLKTESAAWRLTMSGHLLGIGDVNQKQIWLKAQQEQLVMLSNQLNQYLFREQKVWANHTQAAQIKIFYGQSLACFEELLGFAEHQFPAYYDPTVKITDFRLRNVLPGLRHLVADLKIYFETKSVDPKLCELVIKAINKLLLPDKVSNAGAKYIMHLIHEIESLPDLTQNTLIDLLVKLDFNQPEFYLYQTNAMSLTLQQIDGLHEELEHVLQQKEDLRNSETQTIYSLYPHQTSLKRELHQYYTEKAAYLEELLVVRRTAMQDRYDSERAFRILVGMSVPQLALFVRVLKEKEIILREGITEVLTFFSRHFYTDKALFISSHNLLKRSSDVDFTTVLKLWDMLEGMMNWLDEKFHVRNYERSTG
jgi:hypothetical protein